MDFYYEALDARSKRKKGTISAASMTGAIQRIKETGVYPTLVRPCNDDSPPNARHRDNGLSNRSASDGPTQIPSDPKHLEKWRWQQVPDMGSVPFEHLIKLAQRGEIHPCHKIGIEDSAAKEVQWHVAKNVPGVPVPSKPRSMAKPVLATLVAHVGLIVWLWSSASATAVDVGGDVYLGAMLWTLLLCGVFLLFLRTYCGVRCPACKHWASMLVTFRAALPEKEVFIEGLEDVRVGKIQDSSSGRVQDIYNTQMVTRRFIETTTATTSLCRRCGHAERKLTSKMT
jgi:hypothetical protein